MERFHLRLALVLVGLCLTAAEPVPPVVQVFFGPKAADDGQGLLFNLLRFLDTAQTSIYGSLHEVDMIVVAEKLAAKAERGVDVQLVIESRWWNNSKNKAAKQVLEKSKVRVILDTKNSGLLHDKFFIIDGRRVWTGSTNLTESCLFFNPNNSVWVENEKIAANYLSEFEEQRAGHFGKIGSGPPNTPYPVVETGPLRIRTFFSPEDRPAPAIIEQIDRANKTVEVMCFVFSSQPIAEALLRAHQRGVRVRVLLDNLFSSPAATARWKYVPFQELKKAGIACKYDDEDSKFHHKVVIVDGTAVVLGSFNLSGKAGEDNDENVLIIEGGDIAGQYRAEFERWWRYYSGDPGQPPPLEAGDDNG